MGINLFACVLVQNYVVLQTVLVGLLKKKH